MIALSPEGDAAPRADRWRVQLVVLLAFLAAVLAASLFLRMHSESSGWLSTSTAIGDYRRLPLSDGSTLELNTDTKVRYRLSETVRELELTSGEARFRIAHDARRPFVVFARDTVIRAVGTEFTVRIRGKGRVEVVVAEGVVAVSHHTHASAMSELLHGHVVPLEGGSAVAEKRVVMDDGGRFSLAEMTRTQIEAHDAWRHGMLVFEETPLREVVDEFNRYDRRKLAFADPAIGEVLLGGRYRPRDVEEFLHNLGTVVKIRVVEERSADGDGVVLRIYNDSP